jgi:hypothetical protein
MMWSNTDSPFADMLCNTISAVVEMRRSLKAEKQEKEMIRRAQAEAEADHERWLQRQREWLLLIQSQASKGRGGFATQVEARAALSGKGGRSNPLDQRRW